MAKVVIKKGGKREPFRPAKLKASVRGACMDAHLSPARRKRVISLVAGPVLRSIRKQKAVKVAALRKKVLARLRKVEPAAAKAWLKYERRRRSRRTRR